ncbi:MAG TPA: GlsB/YeaQ/YmgE family stress response membrane protein [Chitinophagaceae bacterium]
MTLTEILILLLIAALCGGIGQALAGYNVGGCLVSIVVGFIGAYIGMWLAGKFDLPEIFAVKVGGKTFPIVWAIVGSALLTFIIVLIRRAISGGRRY